MHNNKRVLVAMSGGIDSSAVCLMLQEQGYEVVGMTMRVYDLPRQFAEGETDPDFIRSARELADRLGIEHHVADVRKEFRESIVAYFIGEYEAGRTPNPCVCCNRDFKFRLMREWANRLDCAFMATGHYVKRKRLPMGLLTCSWATMCVRTKATFVASASANAATLHISARTFRKTSGQGLP